MRWPRRSRAVPSRYVSCFFNLPRADFHVRLHAFSNAEAQRDQGLLLRSELGPRLSELVNYISNGFVFVSKSLCVVLKLLLLWSAAPGLHIRYDLDRARQRAARPARRRRGRAAGFLAGGEWMERARFFSCVFACSARLFFCSAHRRASRSRASGQPRLVRLHSASKSAQVRRGQR